MQTTAIKFPGDLFRKGHLADLSVRCGWFEEVLTSRESDNVTWKGEAKWLSSGDR
jgi:hypothetical protein